MINNRVHYSLLTAIVCISQTTVPVKGFAIESVAKFDGIFFTADTIEILKKYQRSMFSILNGQRQSDGSYRGAYNYKNNFYGSRDLAKIEEQLEEQKNNLSQEIYVQEKQILNTILSIVLNDFKSISYEFEDILKEAKTIVSGFIKESCMQRNRPDSLLIQWSQTAEGTEFEAFKKEITNFKKFDQFCIDLFNFFSDLIESCPKAKQVFENRIIKWKKVREVLEKIKQSGYVFNEQEFLKYIKQNVLDSLHNDTINNHTIINLIETFERS